MTFSITNHIFYLQTKDGYSMKQIAERSTQPNHKRITRASIIQSAISGLYIFFAFWAMYSFHSELAIASLGANTFITFSSPNAEISRPRFMLSSYCLAIAIGFLCNLLIVLIRIDLLLPEYIPACALAMFLTMFLMTVFNLKHPPAAAFAVAVTLSSEPVVLSTAALICIIVLCILKQLFKKHLYDL